MKLRILYILASKRKTEYLLYIQLGLEGNKYFG